MKLLTYRLGGRQAVGALTGDGKTVLSLPYPDMNTLIVDAKSGTSGAGRGAKVANLFCEVNENNLEEAARYNADAFEKQKPVAVYFSKRVTEAVAPGGDIPRHAGLVERLDYESELAVILGKTARNVKAAEAGEYIFGYTIINDVSARDVQTGHKQWYFGKGLDGFTPMGPWIVTADEIPFPPALDIGSTVNGEVRQKSNTALFLTPIQEVLEELTSGMTLLPATIIATGTPAGSGMGFDPPKFLKTGDVVECTIQGIGSIRNTVR